MKAVDSGSDSDRKRSRSRSRSPAKFREGDKVEAKLSGQRKWSKAKVRRVRDDTYDLDMDDGEREKRVKPKYIRKRGGSRSRSRSRSRSPRGRKLREGDKCEARFRGKSSAKSSRGVHRPSTSHKWRRRDAPPRHRRVTLASRRYYKGKVSRIHSDGTIDVKSVLRRNQIASARWRGG